MMKIENIREKNRSVTISGVDVQFDENGIAEVDDAIGAQLLKLGGYCRPNKPPAASAASTIPAPASAPEAELALESMSAAQLKKLAKDRGIDVGDASRKADLVDLIQKAQA